MNRHRLSQFYLFFFAIGLASLSSTNATAAGASPESLKSFEGDYKTAKASSAALCGEKLELRLHNDDLVMNGSSQISNFYSVNDGLNSFVTTYVGKGMYKRVDTTVRATSKSFIKEVFDDGNEFSNYSGNRTLKLSSDGQTLVYKVQSTYNTQEIFGTSRHWTTEYLLMGQCVYQRVGN